jgi:hypothetical protein
MNVLLYVDGSTDDQGLVGSRVIAARVPEPRGTAMLIAGAAFLGLLYRRRVRGLRLG